jgi:hypothetical protein
VEGREDFRVDVWFRDGVRVVDGRVGVSAEGPGLYFGDGGDCPCRAREWKLDVLMSDCAVAKGDVRESSICNPDNEVYVIG